MATYRYPVLLWPDASGATTAALVGDFEQVAARAESAPEALRQLRELLDWRMENERWNIEPDFEEARLAEVKVEIRPQYREGRRLIPCPDTLWLRVPCVTGLQDNGLRLCALPHLGLRFNYQDEASLKSLVAHYVTEALQGLSPLRAAAHFPPRDCRLEELVVHDRSQQERKVLPLQRRELKLLLTVADPLLHDFGRKRTASAAYERDDLSQRLADKLAHTKANLLLVGETGVGKSTVLLDAVKRAWRARSRPASGSAEVPSDDFSAYRFWRSSAGRLIAGMRYLGEWEERCEEIIERLSAIDGVWCAENLLELIQVGGQGPGGSVAAFFLPYLQRGELRLIAEATPSELEACRRLLPGLLDVFQIVVVPPFTDAEAVAVLQRIAQALAATARMELEPQVIDTVHRLFKRFLPYAAFPGPAARFVRTLLERRALPKPSATAIGATLRVADVVARFVQETGLPEIFLRDDLPLVSDELERQFGRHIIGQPDAAQTAARLVTTIKAGLTDPGRPPGVLLFCGPTGVGKTALARLLADYCFGASDQKDRLIRLDMSEYAGWEASLRFLQGPSGEPAPWLEKVRRHPFCLLLFDEIEKAAPQVFDVLLGLLDEGRLTDGFGRVTNFRSAIIIMTSNLGSSAAGSAGFGLESGPAYEAEVAKFFRPEFFNRLDAVVRFKALSQAEVEAITRKELGDLAVREGFVSAHIRLEWTESVVAALARAGYDRQLGARPLQRALERMVAGPLARWRVAHPHARDRLLRLELDPTGKLQVVEVGASP